ncbi:hypothetical protein EON63_12330 [archaeon]|nr:MAG: hypothetical protein EON63_12330 [archaeon]
MLQYTLRPTPYTIQVREAQLQQYNFILVVGNQEATQGTVNIRTRENEVAGMVKVEEVIERFRALEREYK